jgi:hypothetical protein
VYDYGLGRRLPFVAEEVFLVTGGRVQHVSVWRGSALFV